MFYSHKPNLETLFIFALFLLPITKAASDELPQQQTQMMEANGKIAALAADQQRTARTIGTLQTSLNAAHQEIRDLRIKHQQLVEANAETLRTANGHGRGGR
ncbi:MAG: hypothetical protein PHD43_00945 [Methylococcales bacterium]|nr:hypothetical protein [Methylococcales bacterium]